MSVKHWILRYIHWIIYILQRLFSSVLFVWCIYKWLTPTSTGFVFHVQAKEGWLISLSVCTRRAFGKDTLIMMYPVSVIGTKLHYRVIMKPSTPHDFPPPLQPEGSVSLHLNRLRFIIAHFHRPPPLYSPRPKLCSCLDPPLHLCEL